MSWFILGCYVTFLIIGIILLLYYGITQPWPIWTYTVGTAVLVVIGALGANKLYKRDIDNGAESVRLKTTREFNTDERFTNLQPPEQPPEQLPIRRIERKNSFDDTVNLREPRQKLNLLKVQLDQDQPDQQDQQAQQDQQDQQAQPDQQDQLRTLRFNERVARRTYNRKGYKVIAETSSTIRTAPILNILSKEMIHTLPEYDSKKKFIAIARNIILYIDVKMRGMAQRADIDLHEVISLEDANWLKKVVQSLMNRIINTSTTVQIDKKIKYSDYLDRTDINHNYKDTPYHQDTNDLLACGEYLQNESNYKFILDGINGILDKAMVVPYIEKQPVQSVQSVQPVQPVQSDYQETSPENSISESDIKTLEKMEQLMDDIEIEQGRINPPELTPIANQNVTQPYIEPERKQNNPNELIPESYINRLNRLFQPKVNRRTGTSVAVPDNIKNEVFEYMHNMYITYKDDPDFNVDVVTANIDNHIKQLIKSDDLLSVSILISSVITSMIRDIKNKTINQ
jgi:hypothetical protein